MTADRVKTPVLSDTDEVLGLVDLRQRFVVGTAETWAPLGQPGVLTVPSLSREEREQLDGRRVAILVLEPAEAAS